MKIMIKSISAFVLLGLLSGCAVISGIGKDNTPPPSPLVAFTPEMTPASLWTSSTGNGTDKKVLKFVPVLSGNTIYTADASGDVVATSAYSGRQFWRIDADAQLTAGPATNGSIVVVGTVQGELLAYQATNGKLLWNIMLPNQVLGAPAVTMNQVIVETVDGNLVVLNSQTGTVNWIYNHTAPTMILRGGSTPQVYNNSVIAGFSDGKLSAYDLSQGHLLWERFLAEPMGASDVEQMIDVVADPIIANGVIYVVNYQGNISAIDPANGQVIWSHPLSSYTGMAISNRTVFVTDAQGYIWAFDRNSGDVIWRQTALTNRILSAPAIQNNMLVVADGEGVVHWLSQQDGHFVARAIVANNVGISAAPVVNGNLVYVLNNAGLLTTYRVQ